MAHTFVNRILLVCSSFAIVVLSAKYFGAEGRGIISLFMLALTIVNAVSFIGSGSSLTLLQPQLGTSNLLLPALFWIVISVLSVSILLYFFSLIAVQYFIHLLLLGLLNGLFAMHLNLLLGEERIKEYNVLQLLQSMLLLVSLILFVFAFHRADVIVFFYSLYISFFVCVLICTVLYVKQWRKISVDQVFDNSKSLLSNGFQMQSGAIIQSLNYRVAYFFLESWVGLSAVGIFSTTIAIVEGLWTASKSIALVMFARVANMNDQMQSKLMAKKYAAIGLLVTIVLWLIACLIPEKCYQLIFGLEFSSIPLLLLIMGPGIILFGYVYMVSHYFSGIALHKYNIFASAVGLFTCIVSCVVFIPNFNELGAAWASVFSFVSTGIVLLILFFKRNDRTILS
ncbi:MAG TPA: polysaccharide biosynthesis C-terminal domain-containing protein [Bacteroidia bacterium]|nr:polysaccharide biosynthesis C-terminal domain-containing protein [Bacteroidia bacterium]HNT79534.1 polysaccharide biosynthesis C-terminal domain-containing protein [Bacteroidia bacterium]